jgi:hypothetical protein
MPKASILSPLGSDVNHFISAGLGLAHHEILIAIHASWESFKTTSFKIQSPAPHLPGCPEQRLEE